MYEIIIDCTNQCFMNCKYCGTDSAVHGSQYLDESEIVKLINIANRYHMQVFLGGGCFFCHPDWIEILDYNRQIGASVYVDVPLTEPVIEALQKYSPEKYNYSPSVSLWGVGKTHDILSGRKSFYLFDSYQNTVGPDFRCSFVITNDLLNQKEELIAFINKLEHCQQIYFHRLMPTGRCNRDNLPRSADLLCFKEDILTCVKFPEILKFHHTLCAQPCRAYRKRIFIDWAGNIFGCGWVDLNSKTIANIKDVDIEEIICQSIDGQFDGQIVCPICE